MISSTYFSGIPQSNFVRSFLSSPYCKIVAVALLALLTSPTRVKADLSNTTAVALNDTEFNTTSGTPFQQIFESGRMVEQKTQEEFATMVQNHFPKKTDQSFELDEAQRQEIFNHPDAEVILASTTFTTDDENLEAFLDTIESPALYHSVAISLYETKGMQAALPLFHKAADGGHVPALSLLASLYFSGTDVEKDYDKALEYCRRAAALGGSEERYTLGTVLTDVGHIKNDMDLLHEGIDILIELGKNENNNKAQEFLSRMYFSGKGVKEDEKKAFKWARMAAQNGNTDAKFMVGVMYGTGRGVEKSSQRSLYWLAQAAEEGHVKAQSWFSKEKHGNEL